LEIIESESFGGLALLLGRAVTFKFSLLVESQQGKTEKRQSLIIWSTDPLLELSAAIIDLDWSQ
jgi:hypothetical protein